MAQPADPEIEVSTEHAAAALADGSAEVIDVREGYERDAGHIAGTRHIELARLPAEAQTIDRGRRVIFHCHVGSRSLMAAQAFRQAGFDAWSMAGGMEVWEQEGRPVERDGGGGS
jgi:rhodanese-related sulfurtransferase